MLGTGEIEVEDWCDCIYMLQALHGLLAWRMELETGEGV